MLEAKELASPLEVLSNAKQLAREQGARALRIEGTLANEELEDILLRRHGLVNVRGRGSMEFPLEEE